MTIHAETPVSRPQRDARGPGSVGPPALAPAQEGLTDDRRCRGVAPTLAELALLLAATIASWALAGILARRRLARDGRLARQVVLAQSSRRRRFAYS
jgi:hypothetical protein